MKSTIVFIVVFHLSLFTDLLAQKIYIQTDKNVGELNIENRKTKQIEKIKAWNDEGNSFIFHSNNLETSYILLPAFTECYLYNDKSKKGILAVNQSLSRSKSIQACFDSIPNIDYTSHADFLTNFMDSASVIEVRTKGLSDFKYDIRNPNVFCKTEDIYIRWETENRIEVASIEDLTEQTVVWYRNNINFNQLNYDLLKDNLKTPFAHNHKYRLILVLESNEYIEAPFDFSLKPLAFAIQKDRFYIPDSLCIAWNTVEQINDISIVNTATKETVWYSDNYDSNILTYKAIEANLTAPLEKAQYQLIIHLKNENTPIDYSFTFRIRFLKEEVGKIEN